MNHKNEYKQTALHIATISNNLKLIKILIGYNADLDSQDILSKTALIYAVE